MCRTVIEVCMMSSLYLYLCPWINSALFLSCSVTCYLIANMNLSPSTFASTSSSFLFMNDNVPVCSNRWVYSLMTLLLFSDLYLVSVFIRISDGNCDPCVQYVLSSISCFHSGSFVCGGISKADVILTFYLDTIGY